MPAGKQLEGTGAGVSVLADDDVAASIQQAVIDAGVREVEVEVLPPRPRVSSRRRSGWHDITSAEQPRPERADGSPSIRHDAGKHAADGQPAARPREGIEWGEGTGTDPSAGIISGCQGRLGSWFPARRWLPG
jgi:hypothetical protein